MKRLDGCLLSGVGVLAVHQVAYSASNVLGADSVIGHGHLATAWLLAGFAALTGLVRSVTRSLRHRGTMPASLPALSTSILVGYVAMEAVERLLDGSSLVGLAGEAVFWLGLAATPLVAAALRAMTQTAHELARHLIGLGGQSEWPSAPTPSFGTTSVEVAPLLLRSDSVSRRGPPLRS